MLHNSDNLGYLQKRQVDIILPQISNVQFTNKIYHLQNAIDKKRVVILMRILVASNVTTQTFYVCFLAVQYNECNNHTLHQES